MSKEEEVKAAEEEEQPKKSKLKLIVLASLVIILGAGGFFGWKWYSSKKAHEEATKESDVSIIFPLKSFIVNLVDKSGTGKRYLKLTLELEIGGEEQKLEVEKRIPPLRDTILLLLSSRSLKEIGTMEGKLELKQALLMRINRILGDGTVHRVYFTEFVVQ